MAQNSAASKGRPISPHLSIWRWGPAMFISILHRVSGNGLAVAGLATLLYWLGSLAGGAESYARFQEHAQSWYGMVVLIGISWAFFNHLASGLRHFVMDMGAGYELSQNNRWSILTPMVGILLTAAFWALALN